MKLAEAFVDISLRSRRLLSGLRKAENRTERSARKMGRSMERAGRVMEAGFGRATKALKGFLAAAAGAFAVRAMTANMQQLANSLDDLAKSARTVGTDVDTLSALGFAANMTTSISPERLNKSLERFVKRVGEARLGLGQLQPILEEMGISATELARLPLDEAFFRFAGALDEFETQGEKLAATQKAFGIEGRALLPLLSLQEQEIRALARQGRVLAGDLSRASTEAEAYNDSITQLSLSFKGLRSELLATAGPALTKFNEGLTEALLLIRSGAWREFNPFSGASDAERLGNILRRVAETQGQSPGTGIGESGAATGGAGESSGGGRTAAVGASIGNTMLGQFRIAQESVSVLKRIEKSNERIAEAVRDNMTGVPLT
jgi:hypothetical protein